jgi:tripartite-type tricarboxylate transporter receptor subunit TctC
MQRRDLVLAAGASTVTVLGSSLPAWAQPYPSKALRMVVPFPPGGPTDAFARLFADGLGKQLGQNVIIENKAGAGGAIGSLEVKNSAADGYTLLFGTASTHCLYNLIELKPRYSATEDFDYVATLGGAPVALAVSTNMPTSLKGLFDAAKRDPGKFSYGSPGTGTLLHVATEQALQLAGVTIAHVPYKGTGPAVQDLLGGNIHMAVGTLGGLLPLHTSGKLRIVGVATAKRMALSPDIPTISESAGFTEALEALLWSVLAVPQNTPSEVRKRLSDAVRLAMATPEMIKALNTQSIAADLRIGDVAANAFVKSEASRWKPVVDKLGDAVRS